MNQVRALEERIVEAAVQLFADKGFNGTSTRDIARLADVNESSLFRYFSRKQDLFWAAMETSVSRLRVRKELRKGLTENKLPAIVLPLIVEFLVETASYQPELIRMLRFGLLELGPGAERVCREQLGPIFNSILQYMEKNVGNAAEELDSSILTIAILTTSLTHVDAMALFTGSSSPYACREEKIAAYSRFWLHLLAPAQQAERSRERDVAELRPAPALADLSASTKNRDAGREQGLPTDLR